MTSWAGSAASEVCGRGKRSGQRRMRLGPAAKYLLSRERGDGEERPKEKISEQAGIALLRDKCHDAHLTNEQMGSWGGYVVPLTGHQRSGLLTWL